jgi:6-phosphogluconolactonase
MIRVFPDPPAAAAALAARVAAEAAAAIATRGAFRLALSGGTTPRLLYQLLASEWRDRIDWKNTTLLLADERAVPEGSQERNDTLVRETLVVPLGIADGQLLSMHAEVADLETAARDYEQVLEPPLDLLLLGLGPDGHVASLFPGHTTVLDREHRVLVERNSPKPPPVRLTLAPRAIDEARTVCTLVTGEDKADAVAKALGGTTPALDCPGSLVAHRDWYLDRPAASRRAQSPHRL